MPRKERVVIGVWTIGMLLCLAWISWTAWESKRLADQVTARVAATRVPPHPTLDERLAVLEQLVRQLHERRCP